MRFDIAVFAGLAGLASVLAASPPFHCDYRKIITTVPANSTDITYYGGWTLIHQDSKHGPILPDGVEAYSTTRGASYTLLSPVSGGNLTIYSPLADNRGDFNVIINNVTVYTGDEYDAKCTAACIYERDCSSDCDSLPVYNGDLTALNVVKGDNITVQALTFDYRFTSFPVLGINELVFTPANC